jgi:PAS domain S-box-containing protein
LDKATIMIIEDESIIAKDIEYILRSYNYNVAGPFSKAEEAIKLINEIKPDLILMDVVLKGEMDGVDAADIIKKQISVPIIYLTAYADDVTINRIKKTEPYGYFLKPFEEKELYTWIETTLHKFKAEQSIIKIEHWIKSILKCYEQPIIAFNENGEVQFINNIAETILGFDEENINGKKLNDILNVFDEHDSIEINSLNDILQKQTEVHKQNHSYIIDKDKNRKKISYSIYPVDEEDISSGYIFSFNINDNKAEKSVPALKLEEKLAESKKELEQFAYIASHDLQEPLRMIASYVQLLQRRYQGKLDADADEFISFAVEGVTRMKSILNDLLAYSRINTKTSPFVNIDMNRVIEEIKFKISRLFESTTYEISCDDLPQLRASESQIKELFYNLLINAVKFNDKEKAKINIGYTPENDYHLFSIRDNGIGIEKEYTNKIFEVFQRLHTQDEYPGTGIGLAICKKIIENHSGRIWIESEPGKGSTFKFTLKK